MGGNSIQCDKRHRLLAEGNFALSVCEGHREAVHNSCYDLYRIAGSKIVGHWESDPTTQRMGERKWKFLSRQLANRWLQ
jgi:hypothetical protein